MATAELAAAEAAAAAADDDDDDDDDDDNDDDDDDDDDNVDDDDDDDDDDDEADLADSADEDLAAATCPLAAAHSSLSRSMYVFLAMLIFRVMPRQRALLYTVWHLRR